MDSAPSNYYLRMSFFSNYWFEFLTEVCEKTSEFTPTSEFTLALGYPLAHCTTVLWCFFDHLVMKNTCQNHRFDPEDHQKGRIRLADRSCFNLALVARSAMHNSQYPCLGSSCDALEDNYLSPNQMMVQCSVLCTTFYWIEVDYTSASLKK